MSAVSKIVESLKRERAIAQGNVDKIDRAISALQSAGGSGKGFTVRRKPKFSAAARERIASAQRKRWAKIRAAQKK